MRRTISNLSRELSVSRPRIYRAMERLGFEKKAGGEFSLGEWELLKTELSTLSKNNKQKMIDAENVNKAGEFATLNSDCSVKIADINVSTLKERLRYAKQEYDYNRELITKFQKETDWYYENEGKTTMQTHNGTMAAIPSIVNNEKYVKLNITLSKLITELESDLDLEAEGDDDPFA